MLKSGLRVLSISIVLLLTSSSYAQKKAKTAEASQLAKVVILPFTDDTKSEDYGYLSGSLVDAIDKKMQKGFEYQKANFAQIKTLHNYQSEILTDKQIKTAAGLIGADIVIYGVYTFDQEAKQIVISIDIHFPNIGERKSLDPIRNPVDSTLFTASDRAADTIIVEISSTIERHNQKVAAKNKETVEETTPGKKKKITTAALKTRRNRTSKSQGFQLAGGSEGYVLQYEIQNEKFPVNWFSTYGSFGLGIGNYSPSDIDIAYVKIPIFTPLSIFALPFILFSKKPFRVGSFPLMDGIAIHLRKPGAKSWLSIYLGGYFGLGYGKSPSSEGVSGTIGLESGLKLYLANKTTFNVALTVGYPMFYGLKIGMMKRFGK